MGFLEKPIVVPVGEWLPDLPDYMNKGAITAKNVIPGPAGYSPVNALSEQYNALNARAQGHFAAKDKSGNLRNYAGTSTKLYHLTAPTWSDISSTTYACPADSFWEFTQWNETVIAVNGVDNPQRASIGATAFIALPGAPPVAKHIGVVKDFVVLGNTTTNPNEVRWSAINNSESYTITVATQADNQYLYGEGGGVQRVVGGEYGTIFQEKQIVRMQYVGPPAVFQFEPIDRNRGAITPGAVVPVGDLNFYLSDSGFYVFDGAKSYPIGESKIDKFFFRTVDLSYIARMHGAADPERKIVAWVFPGSGSSAGTPNKALFYNWAIQRWSYAEFDCEILAQFLSPGYTLEQLDAFGTLETLSASMDSRQWMGGRLSFGGFTTNHKLGTFSGSILTATVDTGEVNHAPGRRSVVTATRPIVDGSNATVAVGSRNLLSASPSFGNAISSNSTGLCNQRVDARYHRYRISSTDFNWIQGVEIPEIEPGGER